MSRTIVSARSVPILRGICSRGNGEKKSSSRISGNGKLITSFLRGGALAENTKIHSIRGTRSGLWWVTKASFQSPWTPWAEDDGDGGACLSLFLETRETFFQGGEGKGRGGKKDGEKEGRLVLWFRRSWRPQEVVSGQKKGSGEGCVMPPLGQTLMGLWASEAYSFHSLSTSRFPSILFHNTPGDVYVLQDGRKMRSRLHSDIGRFTGLGIQSVVEARERNRSSKSCRKEGGGRERKRARGQSLAERSSWDLRGCPDYFSHRWFALHPKNRTTPIEPSFYYLLPL